MLRLETLSHELKKSSKNTKNTSKTELQGPPGNPEQGGVESSIKKKMIKEIRWRKVMKKNNSMGLKKNSGVIKKIMG